MVSSEATTVNCTVCEAVANCPTGCWRITGPGWIAVAQPGVGLAELQLAGSLPNCAGSLQVSGYPIPSALAGQGISLPYPNCSRTMYCTVLLVEGESEHESVRFAIRL